MVQKRTAFGDLPDLATRAQVAEYTQTSIPTLARWHGEGKGPKVITFGARTVRYRREDVLAWLEASERKSTAEVR